MSSILKSGKLFFIFLIFTFAGTGLFAKSYKPDFNVKEFIEEQTEVQIFLDGKTYVVVPAGTECNTAFIFYPGGYVEYESYLPLLAEISKKGIICVMPKMFGDLAIFNISAADKIIGDVVEGGNHSGFGNYGFQKGDGQASLDVREQKLITAELVLEITK